MIPAPWVFVLIALGSWRLWRLVALDDLPPVERLRNRLVRARWLPATEGWYFDRPTLAHFIACGYCSGFWIVLAAWAAWLAWPTGAVVALAPFALSAVVGLLAQHLG